MTRKCDKCGCLAEAPKGTLPAGWSISAEGGSAKREGVVFICGACVRLNLRSMEARLRTDDWEQ